MMDSVALRSPRFLGELFLLAGLIAGALGVVGGLVGCDEAPRPEPVAVQAPPAPPEPQLPVASDAQVTLFGEMPDRARIPFQSRSSSPMKQHTIGSEGADFDVRVSPDGKWLAFVSTRHSPQPDLYLKTVDGQAVTQLTNDPSADVQPCFSPDGKRVLFASNRTGNWDLWMLGLENGQLSQITYSPMHELHPTFAPDGKRLAYCAFNDRSGQWELWTLQLDQPGSRRMIGYGLYPEWSPRGDSILYQRARQRGGRWFSIWKVDLDNGEPRFPQELAASSEMALIQPSWSPDGTWVTYGTARLGTPAPVETPADVNQPEPPTAADAAHRNAPNTADAPAMPSRTEAQATRGDIWMMRADGTEAVPLTDGSGVHFSPAWGVDGRVYFSSRQNGSENIWSVKGAAAAPMPVAAEAAPITPAPLVRPAARGG